MIEKERQVSNFQHDKKKCVIPNLFRNLGFVNGKELNAFVLISDFEF